MIGDEARKSLAMGQNPFVLRDAYIKLDSTPLIKGETPVSNPAMRYTNFYYYMRFDPTKNTKKSEAHFLVKADILPGGKLRVASVQGLGMLLQKPELHDSVSWLIKYTNIYEKKLFDVAVANPLINIPISVDIVKYADEVMSNYDKDSPSMKAKAEYKNIIYYPILLEPHDAEQRFSNYLAYRKEHDKK